MEPWQLDSEYVEYVLTEVERRETGWSIEMDGLGCFCPDNGSGVEPHVGDTIRQHGRGFGSPFRSIILNGRVVFYRTVAEQEAEHQREIERYDAEKRQQFEERKAELTLKYEALPRPFQKRIERFQLNNPDFCWKHEAYELFVCEDAVRIATALGDPARVGPYHDATEAEQRRLAPDVQYDAHSGNTFGAACHLALWYLSDPESVIMEHGALCALVGCARYGCVPQGLVLVE